MTKIVVLDGQILNPGDLSWDGLAALGELEVFELAPSDEAGGRLRGRDAVLTCRTRITAGSLDQAPGLRYIGALTTGFDDIDVDAAKARGVTVTNVPAYGSGAVAQHAIALLLEICHRAGHYGQAVNQGRWGRPRGDCFWDYPVIELGGKTMGIVGLGRIGLATAVIARAMGMEVVTFSAYPNPDAPDWVEYLPLSELLPRSHVVSLSCPLTPETAGIVNRQTIAAMRDSVVIVNVGRGGLIVEADLAEALRSGKVYGAGLDVVSIEPIRPENPLMGAPNCVITPHVAGSSVESRRRVLEGAVDNLASFLAGRPKNVVNP